MPEAINVQFSKECLLGNSNGKAAESSEARKGNWVTEKLKLALSETNLVFWDELGPMTGIGIQLTNLEFKEDAIYSIMEDNTL